ncbi:MAG: DMT family transporter [Candidatus Moraniibacteriota bacterium]
MLWIFLTVGSYLLGAVANILDKFLLGSKRFSSAPVYAFLVGAFSLWALAFAPWGLHMVSFLTLLFCLASGAVFLFGILLLYFAIGKAQASRVVPVVGAVLPLATFGLAFVSQAEKFVPLQLAGIGLLVFGGLLISFDLPLKLGKRKFFSGFFFAVGAGILLAVAYTFFKTLSASENFVTWYVWTRVGGFLGALSLFLVPTWRQDILASFHFHRKNKKQALSTGAIFVSNKIVGGLSALLFNLALTLGSVTLINALVSVQYVFVLLLAWLVSQKYHQIFEEKLLFWDWAQKLGAIVVIGAGIFLIK